MAIILRLRGPCWVYLLSLSELWSKESIYSLRRKGKTYPSITTCSDMIYAAWLVYHARVRTRYTVDLSKYHAVSSSI